MPDNMLVQSLKLPHEVGLSPCQAKVKDFQERLSRLESTLSHTVAQHKLSVETTKEETTSKTQEGGEGGASEGTDTQNGGAAATATATPAAAPLAVDPPPAAPPAPPVAPPEIPSLQPAAAVGHAVQKEDSQMQIDEPAQAGKPQEACAPPEGDKSGA
ncbi:unnamed protein product [Symbiodinium sp. CCMP2592]|nr:unnamed protein product [Symbiodinium sp. CCMP2592]